MNVVHLTPHLGGGVGRALVGVVRTSEHEINHSFICLEQPDKTQFIDDIVEAGGNVFISPTEEQICKLIQNADIVQLEWWCHPATLLCLSKLPSLAMRLVIWCHTSGLYHEIIPSRLIEAAQQVLLTSPCSFQSPNIQNALSKTDVVYSNGGLEHWPLSQANKDQSELSVAYIGSLNFSKLHPDYVSFLSEVPIERFSVKVIGDIQNQAELMLQAAQNNKPALFEWIGYTENVSNELKDVNVLAYILNPNHYGTNENALLEAMAMGIVPVVLNNPAEMAIVDHGVTGLVVCDKNEFAEALIWLHQQPKQRMKMGLAASRYAKEKYTQDRMKRAFSVHYQAMLAHKKQLVSLSELFGNSPSDWFLACHENNDIYSEQGTIKLPTDQLKHYALREKTKGSVHHFSHYFPSDALLQSWSKQLSS